MLENYPILKWAGRGGTLNHIPALQTHKPSNGPMFPNRLHLALS